MLPQGHCGPQQHEQGVALPGGHVQAAQACRMYVGGPAEQGGASVVLEDLFACPEGVGGLGAPHPEQSPGVQPPIAPALGKRCVGRTDQGDPALRLQPGKSGSKEVDFAYACLAWSDFDKSAQRPALAGQFAVELRESCRHGAAGGLRQLRPAPEGRMNMFGVL